MLDNNNPNDRFYEEEDVDREKQSARRLFDDKNMRAVPLPN